MTKLGSFAAPVFGSNGVAMAAISITGASHEFGEHGDRQIRLVTAAAKRLTKIMATAERDSD